MPFNSIGGNGAGYEAPGQITDPRTMFNYLNCVPSNSGTYPGTNPYAGTTGPYYFVSQPFTIRATPGTTPVAPTTLAFNGGSFVVNLYEARGVTSPAAPSAISPVAKDLIQTINITFPSTLLPAPSLDISPPYTSSSTLSYGPLDDTATPHKYAADWGFYRLGGAFVSPAANYGQGSSGDIFRNTLYNPNDVLVSVSIGHGDARLVAAMPNVPSSAFVPRYDTYTYNGGIIPPSTTPIRAPNFRAIFLILLMEPTLSTQRSPQAPRTPGLREGRS